MKISFDLTFEMESQLRDSIARGDMESVHSILAEALIPTVVALMRGSDSELTEVEFEFIAAQLFDKFIAYTGQNPPSLSDYAVSREGIYEDHP